MMDPNSIPNLLAARVIEVAPLAFMRGRSLNDAFIILDEAQNTTPEQMKMFLTRLGFGSTMVVTGDITQVDLPNGQRSGLRAAVDILRGIDDVAVAAELTSADVVRHRLVSEIVDAYERLRVQELRAQRRRGALGERIEVSNESGIDVSGGRVDQRRTLRHRTDAGQSRCRTVDDAARHRGHGGSAACAGWTCPGRRT